MVEDDAENEDESTAIRQIYDYLDALSMDKQGRILIPEKFRAYAGLVDECVILGIYNRIEIWSKSAWDSKVKDVEIDFSKLGKQFNHLRF
jgi:MraZ protein